MQCTTTLIPTPCCDIAPLRSIGYWPLGGNAHETPNGRAGPLRDDSWANCCRIDAIAWPLTASPAPMSRTESVVIGAGPMHDRTNEAPAQRSNQQ